MNDTRLSYRDHLLAHLVANDGHRVRAYGPDQDPEELTDWELRRWHEADHADQGNGTGPRDDHRH